MSEQTVTYRLQDGKDIREVTLKASQASTRQILENAGYRLVVEPTKAAPKKAALTRRAKATKK